MRPIFGLAGAGLLVLNLSGCGKSNSYKAPPPPPVVTSKPVSMPMTKFLDVTGNTVAVNSVELVARVAGYLQEIDFTDGSVVKKGQKLFVIEPAPYAAKLQQAKAAVASAKAQVIYAQSQYDRQETMYAQKATSQANVEQWLSQRDSAKAQVIEAQANEQLAAINFGYTTVSAPFDGIISRHLVDEGNLVGNGTATTLATITQINPIYVYFNVSELDALNIRQTLSKEGLNPSDVKGAPIDIGLQSDSGYPFAGKIDYVSPSVDPATGTIQVRAELQNDKDILLPGLFVRGQIPLGKPVNKLALPEAALMSDQAGSYVYVVGKNNIVEQERVKTGIEEDGMVAVTGLTADAQVIVDGLQNAAPGNAVEPTEKDIKAPAAQQPDA
ncbi:efflux RND transporter periplasmic adaptor subunit [Acidocella aminolytica]|uniref:efflux RND transporter periplasmic adaptor subunit n=1 Tax=Acidocella aminolytica TaxID=33998 RepID=UPI0018F1F2D6|nr:efflux RND transporter periplasmic adaptor subunit [Acidocella aminolytica]